MRYRIMPSSVILDPFAYDPVRRWLDITFVSGRRYRYLQVPPRIPKGLKSAASRGQFFNAFIRDRFDFIRLADAEPV